MRNEDWVATTCAANFCDEPPGTGGLCEIHWKQQNFLNQGRVTECLNGCWRWNAAKTYGYGQIAVQLRGRRTTRNAHAIAFELWNGKYDRNLVVRHVDEFCHEPGGAGKACVNPYHLKIGTQYDNMQDKVESGRQGNNKGFGQRGMSQWRKDLALELMGVKTQIIDTGFGPFFWRDKQGLTIATCAEALNVSIPALSAWRRAFFEEFGKPAPVAPDDNHDLFGFEDRHLN